MREMLQLTPKSDQFRLKLLKKRFRDKEGEELSLLWAVSLFKVKGAQLSLID